MSMLRTLTSIAVFVTALMSASAHEAATAPYHDGEAQREFAPSVARDWRGAKTERLITTLWYPVDPRILEQPHDIGFPGHAVFRGHPIAWGAPLSAATRKYPLIVLSHGTGGSANDLDWLASALAVNGYIVAGVNHPGNNALGPLTRAGFMLWWERATDVSEVLDALLSDPVFGMHVDRQRIGAVGFSLGGYTVLELAGARTDLKAFKRFCRSSAADAICHPPEMNRITTVAGDSPPAVMSPETLASIAKAGASYQDKRIKAVFAIAPALGEAFNGRSFADVRIPVSLTAGTSDMTAPPDTNVRRIARLLPTSDVVMVQGASHSTFLDTCVPQMIDQLARVCKDGSGIDRDAVHQQTARRVVGFFGHALRS
jgi:predicted dienelactone hydrolase